MNYFDANDKELSSAVVAKAKHALGITRRMPIGRVYYSKNYWMKAVKLVAHHNRSRCTCSVAEAIEKYEDYDQTQIT